MSRPIETQAFNPERRLTFSPATCPLALGRALSLTIDGGARGYNRSKWCNLSPSKRRHYRQEEEQTSEAVKTHRNGALSQSATAPLISTNHYCMQDIQKVKRCKDNRNTTQRRAESKLQKLSTRRLALNKSNTECRYADHLSKSRLTECSELRDRRRLAHASISTIY